ncbi:MAG: recombination mediator RecR [Thermodesulfobacteriota bacterium]|nr:recombination mediator RecR [Thermodesulfobacteriota bacterium]
MMNHYPPSIRNAIKSLTRLPGVGAKTAERLAMHLLRAPAEDVTELAQNMVTLKKKTRLCARCFTLSDTELCAICGDPSRQPDVLCVVEGPAELMSIENTGVFSGVYHVLHGVLSPMDGIGPDDIRIRELITRIEKGGIREVVIATGMQVEGESTAAYVAEVLQTYNVNITRLASGMPMGGDLKYVDPITLKHAMEKRYAV